MFRESVRHETQILENAFLAHELKSLDPIATD